MSLGQPTVVYADYREGQTRIFSDKAWRILDRSINASLLIPPAFSTPLGVNPFEISKIFGIRTRHLVWCYLHDPIRLAVLVTLLTFGGRTDRTIAMIAYTLPA